jgi:hypothetical protein
MLTSCSDESKPLSIRNYNPINIKNYESNKWKGEVLSSNKFEKFESPYWGLRASMIVLGANIKATDSVKDFVLRFGTESHESIQDEHISNYVSYLENNLGYKGKIKDTDLMNLLRLVIRFEGGHEAYTYYLPYVNTLEDLMREECGEDTLIQCIR